LRVHRKTVQRQWDEFQSSHKDQVAASAVGQLDLLSSPVGSDDDRATLAEDELQAEEDAQFAAVTAATAGTLADKQAQATFAREQKLLDEMTEAAESARGRPDARVRKLVDWVRKKMCPELPPLGTPAKAIAKWNDTRILIF